VRTLAQVALLVVALSAPGRAEESAVEALYSRCEGCHPLDHNGNGPMLGQLFGRTAGSVKDFDYSAAFSVLTLHWDDRTLDRFLADPQRFAPGNTMNFRGIDNAAERHALIALLHRVLQN